ncbi:M23 family metallopeptidase [Calothrix anomala FACHB-343]|uniref:M23 family metallopeptidase n=3 Tax=Calotrichaceae TaxID=2661849 RepID=A0ABR8A9R1_9CYAN|nr:M23 family metallopeptidase [Calothrix parietina FACHB-288]MBD2228017.1 M23 family metallopeptidase [Calothrix anomala FACHB-343]
MLMKAGYTVITAPPIGSSRGDAARRSYQDEVQKLKEQTGAYALELHFDEPAGRAGVIAGAKYDASGNFLSVMDVALAKEFGHFPFKHRDNLGAPTRGITILEIAPLNNVLTGLTIAGVNNDNFAPLRDALYPYMERVVKALSTVASASAATKAAESTSTTPTKEAVPTPVTLAGSQITVELGYSGKTIAAYSFIHTGLRFSLFEPNALEFTGQAASWVLTQRIKNTVYTNLSFKKIGQRITSSYGMKLDMPEEGPTYNYFPQRGQTDYEALLIEARRIGYRVYTKGATLFIKPRAGVITDKEIFVLEYGDNMGTSFEVVHEAQKDAEGGARSSVPGANNSTGERKYEIDPDTGQMVQKRKENVIGTGRDSAIATTGSPIKAPAPKTTGTTDKQDADRKANEDRIKGILASAEFPTTPEALTLDPDTPFLTKGVSTFLDRMWVVDTVTHDYSRGTFITKVSCYSPLKNKNASADLPPNTNSNSTSSNPTGYIIPTKGTFTSPFGPRGGRNHNGVDIANSSGTPIYAAASGTVSTAGNASDGYGNKIIIDHSNNEKTLYGHLEDGGIKVQVGQQVQQGQLIGLMGSTGHSTG